MLDLRKKLAAVAIPADKKLYQRQIEAGGQQMDTMVYELYGLSEEGIGVVEGRARNRRHHVTSAATQCASPRW
jgi:Tfp pilus assembly PilM family ATPase